MSENYCPCTIVKPCHPRCTCANGYYSYGCRRCARYGSEDQRRAMAEWLANVIDAALADIAAEIGAALPEGGE